MYQVAWRSEPGKENETMREQSEFKPIGRGYKGAFFCAVSLIVVSSLAPARAAVEPQPDARAVMMRMAEFLSNAQRMSVTVHGAYDALQPEGNKVEWNEIRTVMLSRPNRLRIDSERSDGARSLVLFDGKEITTFDESGRVYAQSQQPGGVDETVVHFVRDLGMRLPFAVLLLSRLPGELEQRVESVEYVEKTTTLGAPAHHLLGRTATVDFQLWIADGDQPLPLRAALTYRNDPGQPQFRAQFSDWNLVAEPPDSTFTFTPPEGANRIPFAAALPQIARGSKGTSVKKGEKR
jgi:hypothetical protein